MSKLRSVAFGLLSAIGMATSAYAGAGEITTTVTPLTTAVTYRTASLMTYIGYEVQIGSSPTNTNTINNVRFTATMRTTDRNEVAAFETAEGATCFTTSADGTSIECSIGQLRAGQSYPKFLLIFRAPLRDTAVEPGGGADIPDGVEGQCATTDCASLTGTTFFAEGTGGYPGPSPQNSWVDWSAEPVVLGTFNPTDIKSALPKGGGTLFSGNGGTATCTDPWTTTLTVPPGGTATTVVINELSSTIPIAPNLYTLESTNLSVDFAGTGTGASFPGPYPNLMVIKLRRDACTIAPKAKIATAVIYYSNPSHPAPGITYPLQLPSCTDTTYGTLPKSGIPCINSRFEFPKKAGEPDALDWVFEIWAIDNGKFES